MIARCRVPSWDVSTILPHCAMTIAPEPDPDARQRATDGAAGPENDRPPPHRGELLLVSGRRDDPHVSAPTAAVSSPAGGESSGDASAWGRRLRLAPPVQLELVSGGEGPGPEVVWASLPQRSREMVLALLARLIDTGAVEDVEG
jgi:hypothetical protein